MQPNRRPSIDGFTTRRDSPLRPRGQFERHDDSSAHITNQETASVTNMVNRRDVSDSLREIDEQSPTLEVTRRSRRRDKKGKVKKPLTKFRLWRRIIIIALVVALLAVGGYFITRALISVGKLTHGDFLSLVTPGTPLATDGNGHTNILILGTSQDDTAHQDASGGGGMWLTDSIMIVSLDQSSHIVRMISIPRDLWTSMPSGCAVGYEAKINAVYECGSGLIDSDNTAQNESDYAKKDTAGAKALEQTVQQVTGLSIQYFAHVNYTVLKQAVDAVGGIKVDITGDGADGIYDTNFDWDCPNGPYTCKNVYYPHDGTYTLNGTQALFLARARADGGAYSYKDFGLDRGDFDRQLNQQKILAALKDKALSAGTLANPLALTGLLDALGNNITTDIPATTYKTIFTFIKAMPKTNGTQSISLDATGQAVVTGQMVSGQSAEVPTSGIYDYSSIINYIARQMSSNPAVSENASIAIYNASGPAGAASDLETKLSQQGLNVVAVGNAASADNSGSQNTVYDTTGGQRPKTIAYLKSLGMSIASGNAPSDINTSADIVIIIGSNGRTSSN